MYKIMEFTELEITNFKGKIIEIIDSSRTEVVIKRNCYGSEYAEMWVLTCLVEVEE